MGQRKSKERISSYDVAPVVSDKDFKYERPNATTHNVAGRAEQPQLYVPQAEPAAVQQHETPAIPQNVDLSLVPDWVNEEHFVDVIKKEVTNFKKITNFKAYPAMGVGENYSTLVLRVGIDVELEDNKTQHKSYMLKVPHDNESMRQKLQRVNFFISEKEMYFDVVPELEKLYREAGVEVRFGANAYKFDKDPGDFYVLLEDLGPRGFRNANRLLCLDKEHTENVLKKLAQFHAASAVRVATKGPFSDLIMYGQFNEDTLDMFESMMSSFQTSFMQNLQTYKDGEKYHDVIDKYFKTSNKELIKHLRYDPSEFNVLNHGDCWINNILFKSDANGQVLETHFVDLQMSKFGTPAHDLQYFLMSSTQIDIKLKHFDHFIRFYHDHLIENLKLLKYPTKLPTLRDLHMQLFKYGHWAVTGGLMILPIVLLDPTEIATSKNIITGTVKSTEFKNLLFTNKRFRAHMDEILPWMLNRGLLEPYVNSIEEQLVAVQSALVSATEIIPEVNELKGVEAKREPVKFEIANKTRATPPAVCDITIPEWVSEKYFEEIAQQEVDHFKHIKQFEVHPATSAGDNYASLMLKVDIDVELRDSSIQPVSYMVKTPFPGEQTLAMNTLFNSFNKEVSMYNEFIPKFERLFQDAGEELAFAPKSYRFTTDIGCDAIVMENLRPHGYRNADRLAGLDMNHTKAVLRKLAMFHAASACFRATGGEFPDIFQKGLFCEETRAIMDHLADSFHPIFIECLKQYNGNEEYRDKVIEGLKNFFPLMLKACQVDEQDFNVLNHGDCWTNNILFQYDSHGGIKDTCFVDYALVKYGSPAQDLYYFLLSSPSLDIKLEHFDFFIKFYHDNLMHSLELLKYPEELPTLKQLHSDLFKYGAWSIHVPLSVLGATLLPPSDHVNMDTLMSEDANSVEVKKLMYSNPIFRQHVEAIYPWLNQRGLLDFDTEVPATPKVASKVPEWLNEGHFVDILEESVHNFSKIIKLNAASATKAGDNYVSTVLRVNLDVELKDGTHKTVSYILKVPVVSAQADEVFNLWNLFKKETTVYREYLPEFESMYRDAGQELVFGPKFYEFKKETGCETVLLEDLSPRGVKNVHRLQGLDLEHTKCVLKKLAQFHAASAKRVELKGAYPEVFNSGIFTEESRHIMEQHKDSYNAIIMDCIREYKGSEEYQHKILPLLEKMIVEVIKLAKVDPDEFNVLNHGDCWLNNIMFEYDEAGSIKETYLVDYQICKYGSPAQDLYYFLMSSPQLDIKVANFDEFIKFYHENLLDNLDLLKYSGKAPSFEELQASLVKYGFLGFAALMGILTVVLVEPHEHVNMETFSADTEEAAQFRKALYANDRYKAHAELVLPWLNKRGLLDF